MKNKTWMVGLETDTDQFEYYVGTPETIVAAMTARCRGKKCATAQEYMDGFADRAEVWNEFMGAKDVAIRSDNATIFLEDAAIAGAIILDKKPCGAKLN